MHQSSLYPLPCSTLSQHLIYVFIVFVIIYFPIHVCRFQENRHLGLLYSAMYPRHLKQCLAHKGIQQSLVERINQFQVYNEETKTMTSNDSGTSWRSKPSMTHRTSVLIPSKKHNHSPKCELKVISIKNPPHSITYPHRLPLTWIGVYVLHRNRQMIDR